MEFTTSSNTTTTSGKDRTLTFATDIGALYSDAGCTTPLTTSSFSQDDTNLTFYFRSATTGTATLTVTSNGLENGTTTLIVGNATAEITLGQQAFNFNTANFPSLSDQSFDYPSNPVIAGNKMFVADYNNNRVLIWNSIPTSTQQAANLVLGQPNMTTNTCNTGGLSAQSLCAPSFVHSDGTRLVVADEGNHRILIWTTLPTSNTEAADLVLGQADMTSNVDGSAVPTATSLSFPGGVFISGTQLFVADSNNNRILVWNTFPTADQAPANVAIGQPNLTSNAAGSTGSTLTYPYMVSVYQNKVFVSDFGNSRILIWNSIPSADGQTANLVLGQPDMTTVGPNTGGVSASSLSEAAGVVFDSQNRLYIFDYSNNRILVWNQMPTTNNQAADAVIGQTNFTSNGINSGGGVGAPSATSLYSPWGALIHNDVLWVSDYENHRILKFTIPL